MMARFTSPPNPHEFYARAWALVRQIPPGRVATYGQIAWLLSPPPGVDFETYRAFGARWVGGAMAACPQDVPWQRVINARGGISPRPGAERQRELLEAEGIVFVNDRIDLKKYGWERTGEREASAGPQQPVLF